MARKFACRNSVKFSTTSVHELPKTITTNGNQRIHSIHFISFSIPQPKTPTEKKNIDQNENRLPQQEMSNESNECDERPKQKSQLPTWWQEWEEVRTEWLSLKDDDENDDNHENQHHDNQETPDKDNYDPSPKKLDKVKALLNKVFNKENNKDVDKYEWKVLMNQLLMDDNDGLRKIEWKVVIVLQLWILQGNVFVSKFTKALRKQQQQQLSKKQTKKKKKKNKPKNQKNKKQKKTKSKKLLKLLLPL